MKYTTTSVTIDPKKMKIAKTMGINISKLLDQALTYAIQINQKIDPFDQPSVKKMLPESAKILIKDPSVIRGRCRYIFNKTGFWIPPKTLLEKLGIKYEKGRKKEEKG